MVMLPALNRVYVGSIPTGTTVAVLCWFRDLVVTQVYGGSIPLGHPLPECRSGLHHQTCNLNRNVSSSLVWQPYMNRMNTEEKCKAIIEKIVELTNEGKTVSFEDDWGGNSLTIFIDKMHTHVGMPDGDFEMLVDNLYNTLHGGPGLSWA